MSVLLLLLKNRKKPTEKELKNARKVALVLGILTLIFSLPLMLAIWNISVAGSLVLPTIGIILIFLGLKKPQNL